MQGRGGVLSAGIRTVALEEDRWEQMHVRGGRHLGRLPDSGMVEKENGEDGPRERIKKGQD